ncbi:MAG TPA: protein kinase [Polyangiaceae bacterium]|nr:protein kinase [Polyangiaceae bacterium]
MAEGAASVRPGQVIDGRYKVERVLGQGGMAMVVAARHLELDELVAIKVILPGRASSPDARERFAREARAAVKIKSEHVARVMDVGPLEDGTPYMVMEYLDGEDFAAVLERRKKIPAAEAIHYALQITDALTEAHSLGIIHRDVKPANLFLAKKRNRPPTVKVLDFGISKVELHDRRRTETKEILGSPWYMAPEQLKSATSVDRRSDIWSLGVILYELVTGEVPFDGGSMTEVIVKVLHDPVPRRDLPEHLEAVIQRCLAKDPNDRYDSMNQVTAALRALVDTVPLSPSPPIADVAALAAAPEAGCDEDDGSAVDEVDEGELLRSEVPPKVAEAPPKAEVTPPKAEVTPPGSDGPKVVVEDASKVAEAPTPISPAVRMYVQSTPRAEDDQGDRRSRPTVPVPGRAPAAAAAPETDETETRSRPTVPVPGRAPAAAAAPETDETETRSRPTVPVPGRAQAPGPSPVDEGRRRPRMLGALAVGLVVAGVVGAKTLSRAPDATRAPEAVRPPDPPPGPASSAPPAADSAQAAPAPRASESRVVAALRQPPTAAAPAPVSAPHPTAPGPHPGATAPAPSAARDLELSPTFTPPPPLPLPVPATPPPAAHAPAPASASASAAGAADDASVGLAVARAHHPALAKACWGAAGTAMVTAVVAVAPGGSVSSVRASTTDPGLARCVEGEVRGWRFPVAERPRTFTIPILFRRR